MGSALSVKNYESPADRRLAGGFLADTSYYFSPVGRHFQEVLESEATNSYGGLRTFASLGPYRASMGRSVQLMDFITNNWRNF